MYTRVHTELVFRGGLTVFELFAPYIFNRVVLLKNKLENVQRKEERESKALENMVHMIEEKLEQVN